MHEPIYGHNNIILNCSAGAITRIRAYYGQGTGPILYDSVGCLGNESVLQQCAHKTITQHNCGHHEDAGVSCQPLGNHTLPRLRWHTFKILLS